MMIEDAIFDMFPDVQIGIVIAKDIDNVSNEKTASLLREAEENIKIKYNEKPVLELPEIKKWREAYSNLGVKKGRRVSIESVAKRILKGGQLPLINPLVDLYNSISISSIFPCGGEDLDQMEGDLILGLANGTETFKTIGSDIDEPPNPNEIVYKDDLGCVCRCWNWREADRTKLTENTKNAILVIESLDRSREEELNTAIYSLSKAIVDYLGGTSEISLLNADNREMKINI